MNSIDGILLVNKPAGISSSGVVQRIKKFNGVNKVGHAGTLDPFATGLLVCCINKATRLSRFFLKGQKKYKGVMQVGIDTDTHDYTGKIIKEYDFSYVNINDVIEAISKFKGYVHQTPPSFSALKHNGVPLYKLARKGLYIDKTPRIICIYNFNILSINLPEISFEIHCSAGTYIRKICSDIGKILECGGHLKSLHRIGSSNFSVYRAKELEYLESLNSNFKLYDHIIPMTNALDFMPSYNADQFLVKRIRNGVKLKLSDFIGSSFDSGFFKVIDEQFNLIAVLQCSTNSSFCKYCCVF